MGKRRIIAENGQSSLNPLSGCLMLWLRRAGGQTKCLCMCRFRVLTPHGSANQKKQPENR